MSDLIGSVETSLAVDLSKQAFTLLKQHLSRWKVGVSSSQDRIDTAIAEHMREVKCWSEEISFKDLQKPKSTEEVFVPLDIYLLPRRQRLSVDEQVPSAPLATILGNNIDTHLAILGQPGAGKTTSVKHLCQQMFTQGEPFPDLAFPILIRLRDLNNAKPSDGDFEHLLIERIQAILDIPLDFPVDLQTEDSAVARRRLRERAVITMLETIRPLVLLDGLDEVSHKAKRDGIIAGVRRLAIQLEQSRLILTARTGEFSYHIEKMTTYEIAPLSHDQIAKFAEGWLGTEDAVPFLKQVRNSPFEDTAIKPLTLAHLCAIFERVRKIPEKPKSVYKKIVSLLLEDWDQQRSVQRVSAYSDFEVDRKQEFLADLAHSLTTSNKTSTFTREDLLESYVEISPNYALPRSEANAVVNELETHTGLIVQSGSDIFEFSHKSLQEFLTALFIVGLPAIPLNMIEMQIMPNELAIAIALSSRPSKYFYTLVISHFSRVTLSFQFVRTFINRMLIERPDFEITQEVGLAILCLYSQYLRASVAEAQQLQLFIADLLFDEFEHLNALIKERIAISDLMGAYTVHSKSHGLDGEEIWRLESRANPQGLFRLYARSNILPPILFVRRSLVDGIAGPSVESDDGTSLNLT